MDLIKMFLFVVIVIFLMIALPQLCRNNTSEDKVPSIYVYYNGKVDHLEYINMNGGRNGAGGSCNIQVHPYGGDWQSVHWNIYKRQIDSVVVYNRNFWSDGLPDKEDIVNGYYVTDVENKEVKIKVIDHTKSN